MSRTTLTPRHKFFRIATAKAQKNQNIWLLIADVGYGLFEEFQKKYPFRFINCGVAEQNCVSVAAGLALGGKKVFVYGISTFITFRALEQIRYIATEKLPVCFVVVGGRDEYPKDGASHNCVDDEDIFCIATLSMPYRNGAKTIKKDIDEFLNGSGPMYIRIPRKDGGG